MIKISRKEILSVYTAGPEAVVAMVEGLVEQFNTRITQLEGKVFQLREECVQLREEVARLKRNSRNSSKPPSSDGYQKPSPKSLRKKRKGKKSGGQKGHRGHTLQKVKKPDKIVTHKVHTCEKCNRSLQDEPVKDIEKRQVFDIPPIKVTVTEHQGEIKECACGHLTHAKFPEEASQPTQYGNRFKSILVYLNHYQLLPLERTSELCKDLFGHSISEGTIFNVGSSCFGRLNSFEESIKSQLIESPVAHFDETGIRINGKTRWLHVASTDRLTCFEAFDKRGQEAMDAMGILPHFMGRAIHDHLKAYFKYACDHGLCNAHHLRELIFIIDHYKQPWAKKMKNHLLDIKKAVEKRKRKAKKLRAEDIKKFEQKYNRILWEGFKANPMESMPISRGTRGRKKQTKAKNLLDRLKGFKNETLAFMNDFLVPFDNNQGERDLRMAKVKMKISGTFRSQKGADIFCRIRAYTSTARKNSKNVFEAICRAMEGNPFIPCPQATGPPE